MLHVFIGAHHPGNLHNTPQYTLKREGAAGELIHPIMTLTMSTTTECTGGNNGGLRASAEQHARSANNAGANVALGWRWEL